jgi:hypothetical protein
MLHFSDVMYGFQHGVHLTAFVAPLRQFRSIAALSSTNFLHPKTGRKYKKNMAKQAMIAAFKQTTNEKNPFDEPEEGEATDIANLTRNRSVYFSNNKDKLSIVIDTGASVSLTPNLQDFVGNIRQTPTSALQGLSTASTKVNGMDTMEWTIRDLFEVVRTLHTTAYYVPDVSICIFIFATYLREQDTGQCLVLMSRTVTTLACGTGYRTTAAQIYL